VRVNLLFRRAGARASLQEVHIPSCAPLRALGHLRQVPGKLRARAPPISLVAQTRGAAAEDRGRIMCGAPSPRMLREVGRRLSLPTGLRLVYELVGSVSSLS
jgi:hypothetical protein